MRRMFMGGLASVLAVGGLVVFATAAAANTTAVQSVSATCTAPGTGAGATVTWTVSNDTNQPETGTLSTAQGTLSTSALSIAASASQTFTQTLSATELAAVAPSGSLQVNWSATWQDGTPGSGTLSTSLAALQLPNDCAAPSDPPAPPQTPPAPTNTPTPPPAPTTVTPSTDVYPGIKTTLVTPESTTVGNSWSDSATVNGVYGYGIPYGTVTFYVCKASDSPSSSATCNFASSPAGTEVGSVTKPSSTTSYPSATYDLAPTTYTPSDVGTYCFYTLYDPTSTYFALSDPTNGGYYTVWGPSECFGVTPTPAYPGIQTTLVTPESTGVGNAWSDSATINGEYGHGVPYGTVTWYVCQASSSPSSSSTCGNDGSGTVVGSVDTPTSTDPTYPSATYDLAPTTYTPPSVGTYCFYVLYQPADGAYYHSVWGPYPPECFGVTPATPSIATTVVTPTSTAVGNAWSDSATVTGNATGGAPTGSVSFSVCKVASGDQSCMSGGKLIGTVDGPTSTSGYVSTYDLAPTTYTPPNVGTYCFYSVYTPTQMDNYTTASGPAECFKVTGADPQFGTQQSGSTSGIGAITLGASVTDTATVTGNPVGGAPTGTVTFTQCATGSSPAVCPKGTQVGSPVKLSGSGDVAKATSAAFTPSATGTYCFAAVYTPDASSNYVTADDNMSGTVDVNECLVVSAPSTKPSTTTPTTTAATPASTPVTPVTSAIAFTGAFLWREWMAALAVLLAGGVLVGAARWRRRSLTK